MYKLKRFLLFTLLVLLLFISGCKSATENEERALQFDQLYSNATIGNITILPNGHILAISEKKGVLLSMDNGKSWEYCLRDDYINWAIAIGKNGEVYVSALSGIYSSMNNGGTWSFTDSISKITIDGHVFGESFNSISVTSNNYVFASSGSSVFCSSNYGKNWYRPDTSFHMSYIREICQMRDTLFLTGDKGVFRSTNYGLKWDTIMLDSDLLNIPFLYYDSLYNIYLSKPNNSTYRSSDNGNTWQEVYKVNFLGFTIGKNNLLFASERDILKSIDNGFTWNIIITESELRSLGHPSITIDKDGYLYLGVAKQGIYKSKKSFYQ